MKLYTLLLPLAFYLISCQPQPVDPPPTQPPAPMISDSSFVQSMVELDTTLTPGSDTTLKWFFSYDAQKRLQNVEAYYAQSGGSAFNLNKKEYTYTGNDSLPSIIKTSFYDGLDSYTFLTYKDHLVYKDSTIYYRNGSKITQFATSYNYLGGDRYFVYTLRTDYPGNTYAVDSLYTHRTWANGNFVSGIDSVYYCHSGTLFDGLWVDQYMYSFDNKVYPFNRMELPYPAYTSVRQQTWFNLMGFDNPVEKLLITNSSGIISTMRTIYNYKYRQDGLPVEINIADEYYRKYNKRLITYTKL